ncbi:helix-turn-helix domain-containing protein [Chryseobacterium jejuense]|uniref:DNA gyrase inhibitor n=1 Tax=Chryseobacterium jejuense TaxID=445960 RepID=A0A2X2WN16_CHRJE|nr:helix-turn-helix domain-containing protein [Chryseobacterium jejuense]SDI31958.1 Two-component response regulator, YesN/AraC family, consists of REC and AraC-type DNA-binding domains [Chryseobacterium jejuense]SQB44782.1 DNA gyrase inhibitor [Chryseobacterium jejuense]
MKGQSGPDFSILTDKAFQKLYQNPEDCIRYSQSLLISEKNIEHKVVLRKIISWAYAMQGNYVQAITTSNQKEEDGQDVKQSRFSRLFGDFNLADQYQNLGLYDQSRKIIEGILADPNLQNTRNLQERMTLSKLYQLQAINDGVSGKYNEALKNFDKSDQYLDHNNEENTIIRQENSIFRSLSLMRSNRLEESKKQLDLVIHEIESEGKSPFLAAFAYEVLSRYYFQKEEYTTAISYLEKGFAKIENMPYNDMKLIFYELFTQNYLALNNTEKYSHYNNLYTDLKSKLDSNRKEGIQYIAKLLEIYHKKNIEYQKQSKLRQVQLIIGSILLLIIGTLVCFYYELRRAKDLKKQLVFFEKQKQVMVLAAHTTASKEPLTKGNKVQDKDLTKLSEEKENEILEKLKEWENSGNYLSKNMSISILSAETGINPKYLSEVINSKKEKNFNGYINDLRISHIAYLLRTDPAYLNYKVSYLAEYAGFSSHGAFTNVFKSITGMSPNHYIQEIIKNKKP